MGVRVCAGVRGCGRRDVCISNVRPYVCVQEYVGEEDGSERKLLMSKQADWASNLNEPRTAAEMYISAGEFTKAIEIIGEHGWADM